MKAAAIFGLVIFLIGLFLAHNIYEAEGQMFAGMVALMGFCLMVAFGLAWVFGT